MSCFSDLHVHSTLGCRMGLPIDPATLDAQTGGDVALRDEVLDLFATQARTMGDQMRQAMEPSALVEALHRLVGSARAIGAEQLGTLAAQCETTLRGGFTLPPEAPARLQALIAETCRFAAALRTASAEAISPNAPKADKHLRPSMSHPDQQAIRDADR